MKERISMSSKELSRYDELKKVHEKRQTIAQAAENLGLSQRQVKRLSKRLRVEGPKGILSKKIGQRGNHRLPCGLKEVALGLIQDHYADFGPTLAHEYLSEQHRLPLSLTSVRNVMIGHGIWMLKARRKKRMFPLRPGRAREGELIQVDGSVEEWFEERGPRCTLLSFVDDATSKIMLLKFVKLENTFDYFDATRAYIERHERPQTFYPDKHAVF